MPKRSPWRVAQFDTLRYRLIKLVTEVTFPESWQVAPDEGAAGSDVRAALGLGSPPPVGRAARYLGGGETLTQLRESGLEYQRSSVDPTNDPTSLPIV